LVGEAYFQKNDYKKAGEFLFSAGSPQFITQTSDVQYRLAFTRYMNGEIDVAIPLFKKLAEANDSISQYAAFYLGQSYLKKGNNAFAGNAFNQARNMKFLPAIQIQSAFYYAKIVYESEKYGDAIDAFKLYFALVGDGKKEEEASELLGESYLNNNNYAEAVQYIEKLPTKTVKINATYQKVTYLKGVELYNSENYPEAIELFEKSLRSPMDNLYVANAAYWIAESYSIGKRWDDALVYYQKMHRTKSADKSDNFVYSQYGIAYAYFNTKDFGKALSSFKDFLEGESKSRIPIRDKNDALIRLGDCSYVLKKYNDAVGYYDKALESNAQDQDYIYYQKGIVSDISGKFDVAIKNFKYVIANFAPSPYYEPSYFRIGQIWFEQGNYTASVDQFTEFIRLFPTSALVPEAYLKRAIAYTNLKDNESAIADFNFLITNFPQSTSTPDALQGIQEAYTAVGRPEEFAPLMTKFKEANPNATGLEKLEFENAKTLYFDQKYEKAIVLFANLIKDYPTGKHAIETNYYLADSYFRTGRPEVAQTYYQAVLDVGNTTPFYNKALQKTAESLFSGHSYAEAGGYYKKLLLAASNKKEFYYAYAGLMQVEYERSNYDSCIFYATKTLEKGNISANATNKANLYLAKSFQAKKDTSAALDYILNLKNSAKDENSAEAQYMLAKIFYAQKRYRQSLEALFDLNENFSIYSKWIGTSFLLIADNYTALKEYYQAKSTLKSIVDNSPETSIVETAKQKIAQIEVLEKGGEIDAQ
jgi:TolA-binding protein